MRQLPFSFLELEGKSACRREKLVRGGRNQKKSEGKVGVSWRPGGKVSLYGRKEPQGRKKSREKGGSKLVTGRKSEPLGEKAPQGAEEIEKNQRGRWKQAYDWPEKSAPRREKSFRGGKNGRGGWKQACDLPKKSACRGEENLRGEKGRMDTGLLLVLKVGVPF
ncbi:MAG: hypothetical protein ACLRS1_06105 [Oscillospiraceae bacterium]